MNIVLIDGDIELYQITSKGQTKADFGDFQVSSFDHEHNCHVLKERINGIIEMTGADDYIFCLTGPHNFRRQLFETYKSNRKDGKPEGYTELKEHVIQEYKTKMYDMLEADDVMGILATMDKKYFILSEDKDMKTLPARLWDKDKKKIISLDLNTANRFLYTQILTGDVTDGYKGCPKIGKIKAERILSTCSNEEEMKRAVLEQYIKVYKDEELAKKLMTEQAQQARILRKENWDFKNKKVILWEVFGATENK